MSEEFIFPSNIWDKIIENLDLTSWKNLSSTCQFFHAYKIVHVKNLEIISNDGAQVDLKPAMKDFKLRTDNEAIKKLYVYQKLHSPTRRPLTPILSKIVKCNLIVLKIEYNNLTWNEYKMLTSSGKIKVLSLEGVPIKNALNSFVPLEEIMSLVPNANDIYIQPCHCTEETITQLQHLPRNVKIINITLAEIDRKIFAYEFLDYFKDVLKPESHLVITFMVRPKNTEEFKDAFVKEMNEAAKKFEWKFEFHSW